MFSKKRTYFLQDRVVNIVLFLIVLCFLNACTTGRRSYSNRYFPVKTLEKRASTLGFSITPPKGYGWYEKVHNETLYYLKRVPTKNYSIYTKATEITLHRSDLDSNKFLAFVKRTKRVNLSSGTIKNHSFNYSFSRDLSPLCIRYNQNYDDYSKKKLKRNEFIHVRNSGLVCMHPKKPKNGVDMYYVESSVQSGANQTKSFSSEGESFLASLTFHNKSEG